MYLGLWIEQAKIGLPAQVSSDDAYNIIHLPVLQRRGDSYIAS